MSAKVQFKGSDLVVTMIQDMGTYIVVMMGGEHRTYSKKYFTIL